MSEIQPVTPAAPRWARTLLDPGRHAQPQRSRPAETRSFAPDDDDSLAHFEASTHFEALFRAALDTSGIEVADSPLVMVLGAGTGASAVAPCLRLFRGCHILATDETDRDFAGLSRHLRQSGAEDRVAVLQMTPEAPQVAPASLDLVAGAFVLHHRVDPDKVLEATARVLKPGGHAIFLEPFDGYGLLRLAFERICAEADLRKAPLGEGVRAALEAAIAQIAARTMPDPSQPGFAELEGKWQFSQESIAAAARIFGFSQARFFSHHDHPTLYRDLALLRLREHMGADRAELPGWAVEVLNGFDRALPPPVKRLLMLEGSIVLTR
ncbi:hypothetical protein DJ021_10075 [Phenylobacterium hankyongense]|uniref:Methyltransferase type 11 domain-containing protein n=1 Tax=Phenylobacterium hankyongense TaxID=1813876 RepID=A0A328B2R0_9CAUL|nr:class I SAM-dependent methyltransferase [Phenylobacterium hankyongense]RAK60124.1 hypothetical protein DJ021_10075 [Phenylobacterium hankyongense]